VWRSEIVGTGNVVFFRALRGFDGLRRVEQGTMSVATRRNEKPHERGKQAAEDSAERRGESDKQHGAVFIQGHV